MVPNITNHEATEEQIPRGWGGGRLFPYVSYMPGMCHCEGYGFQAV